LRLNNRTEVKHPGLSQSLRPGWGNVLVGLSHTPGSAHLASLLFLEPTPPLLGPSASSLLPVSPWLMAPSLSPHSEASSDHPSLYSLSALFVFTDLFIIYYLLPNVLLCIHVVCLRMLCFMETMKTDTVCSSILHSINIYQVSWPGQDIACLGIYEIVTVWIWGIPPPPKSLVVKVWSVAGEVTGYEG
jgi:hypothetical protein